MKLYIVPGGPPSLAVQQTLNYLKIPFELIEVNYGAGDHLNSEYTIKNPQKEIPVLEDDGFFIGESNAILQYICDKYVPDSDVYPKDPKIRAIVNHRLCFNLGTYYRYISEYGMEPIFYDYDRTPFKLKKTHIALEVLDTYLRTLGTKYVAAEHVTIADFALVASTMCLEAISFDLSKYTYLTKWYNTFKNEFPEEWSIVEEGRVVLKHFEDNRPDMSHMKHPLHPVRKSNK